jgi:hypothetical protein
MVAYYGDTCGLQPRVKRDAVGDVSRGPASETAWQGGDPSRTALKARRPAAFSTAARGM